MKRFFKAVIIVLAVLPLTFLYSIKSAQAFPHATTKIYNDCSWMYDTENKNLVWFVVNNVRTCDSYWQEDKSRHLTYIKIQIWGVEASGHEVSLGAYEKRGSLPNNQEYCVSAAVDTSRYVKYKSRLIIKDNAFNAEDTKSVLLPTQTPTAYVKNSNISVSGNQYQHPVDKTKWFRGGSRVSINSVLHKSPDNANHYGVPVSMHNDLIEFHQIWFTENDKSSYINNNTRLDEANRVGKLAAWNVDCTSTTGKSGTTSAVTDWWQSVFPNPSGVHKAEKLQVNANFKKINKTFYVRQRGAVRKCSTPNDSSAVQTAFRKLYGDVYYLFTTLSQNSQRIGIDSTNPWLESFDVNTGQFLVKDSGAGLYKVVIRDGSSSGPVIYYNEKSKNEAASFSKSDKVNLNNCNTGVVWIYAEDNVGNTYTVTKDIPYSLKGWCYIEEYKYKEPGTHNKWANTKEPFMINAQVGTCKKAEPFPTCVQLSIDKKTGVIEHDDYGNRQTALGMKEEWNPGSSKFFRQSNTHTYRVNASDHGIGYALGSCTYLIADHKTANGGKFDVRTTGYITAGGRDQWMNYDQGEVNGDSLLIDGDPPSISNIDGPKGLMGVSDVLSGLKQITVRENDGNGRVLFHKIFDSNKQCDRKFEVNISNWAGVNKIWVYAKDNVDNSVSKTFNIKRPNCNILINNLDPFNVSSVGTNGVLINGRRQLKVDASASGGPYNEYMGMKFNSKVDANGNLFFEEIPIYSKWDVPYKFEGSGQGITLDGMKTLANGKNSMKYSGYIDDKYNTSESPQMSYTTNDTTADLKWDAMKDPEMLYNFKITGQLASNWGWASLRDTVDSKAHPIKFASGFDHYNIKIYRVSGDKVMPSGKPIIDQNISGLTFNMNLFESGWYCIENTMYDFNKNPSGTARIWINHTQPAVYTDLGIEVTAVKDIKWEKAKYPFLYGYGIQFGDEEHVTHAHGTDFAKFPLGKNYLFNGNKIAQGYAINYNLVKESSKKLDSLKVTYELSGDRGESLSAKSEDGQFLEYVDSRENTNYVSETLSKSKLSQFNDTDKVYMKHFIPANAQIVTSSGQPYNGIVTVTAKYTSTADGKSIDRKIPIYAFTTEHTAMDDIDDKKQR